MIRSPSARLSALIVANFAAAASVGFAAMVIVAVYVMVTPPGLSNGIAAMIGSAVFLGMLAAIVGAITGFVCYLAGLIVVGIPTWWALHRVGWTSRFAFVAAGAIESVLGGVFAAPLLLPSDPLAFVLILAAPGGVAGWVIWRLGYDRTLTPPRPSPAPPS